MFLWQCRNKVVPLPTKNDKMVDIIMNDNLLIDMNQYPGAVMYAKSHNISFRKLVDNLLSKFPTTSIQEEVQDTEKDFEGIDEKLLMQTLEAAHQDYLAGRCVPNSEVLDYIQSELGWK